MTPPSNMLLSIPPPPRKADAAVSVSEQNHAKTFSAVPALKQPQAYQPLQQPTASIDRIVHAAIARMTGGLSPAALAVAYWDWASHLALSPGKQIQLFDTAARQWMRLARHALERGTSDGKAVEPCIEPLPQDKRFADEKWQRWPYSLIYQASLLRQQWWHNAVTGVEGVAKQHENVLEFASRQILDMLSPSNFLATNPIVQERTIETLGMNVIQGCQHRRLRENDSRQAPVRHR
jgi:polyhydroxyalkanoate synthase subunit PhaC